MVSKNTRLAAAMLVANISIVLLADAFPLPCRGPTATLYNGGTSVTISGSSCSDLRALDFDNMATSVSSQGMWILYEDYNFHGFPLLVDNTYEVLNQNTSSLRRVGSSENIRENTLTLYQGTNFQGEEQYTAVNQSNLDGSASSLIVTGSTPWTLFSSSNFEGDSICIYYAVYDTSDYGIPRNGIRSASLGCSFTI